MGGTFSSSSSSSLSPNKREKRRSATSSRSGRPRFSLSSEKTFVPPESNGQLKDSEPLIPQRTPAFLGIADHCNSADAAEAYKQFLRDFPEYKLTWIVDTLRHTDYGRLSDHGETYVDYMGGALYPESLIRVHTDFLSRNILGGPHSVGNSLSTRCAEEARAAVLSFFNASPDEYTVIFTPNATGALKLIGESYPFTEGSTYMLPCDAHTSVHGIREFAMRNGAHVSYIPSPPTGGVDLTTAHRMLFRYQPNSPGAAPSLFVLTAQSNITNAKCPLSILRYASALGYHTLLDAAALAPTSTISLTDYPVDAMAVSFYKMMGFPTGVGALIAKKSFLRQLYRPWFSGGNVEVVQVPGEVVTLSSELHEQFEDGTINYLSLMGVSDGLRFLSAYMPFLPLRLSCLMHYLIAALSEMRHENSDTSVVRILSSKPTRHLKAVGAQSDVGSVISLIFLTPSGSMLPNSFVAYAASRMCISLRTGCMSNPGGTAALLGIEDAMPQLYDGVKLQDLERAVGHENGVVRLSFGLASDFQDAWNVLRFARTIGQAEERMALWAGWLTAL